VNPVVLTQGVVFPVIDPGCRGTVAEITMSAPLSLPVATGLVETIRKRYPVPGSVPEGIVTFKLWLPVPFDATLCKTTGDVNEPAAFDS